MIVVEEVLFGAFEHRVRFECYQSFHPPSLKLELSVASVAEGLPSLSTIFGFHIPKHLGYHLYVVRGIWPASRT